MRIIRKNAFMVGILFRAEYVFLFLLGLSVSGFADELTTLEMPGEACGYILEHGDQFKVSSVRREFNISSTGVAPYNTSYPANVSCTISFRTSPSKRFFMRVTMFEVQASPLCVKDALYLYEGVEANEQNLITSNGRNGLCGLTLSLPNYFYTSSNEVTVKFVTDGSDNNYRGFNILITPFRLGNCSSSEIVCQLSGKCITRDARCNHEFQCEDGSDEPSNCYLVGPSYTYPNTSPNVPSDQTGEVHNTSFLTPTSLSQSGPSYTSPNVPSDQTGEVHYTSFLTPTSLSQSGSSSFGHHYLGLFWSFLITLVATTGHRFSMI